MEEGKGGEKEKKKVNKGGKGGQVGKRMPAGRKTVAVRHSTSGSSHDEDGEEMAGESQVHNTYCVSVCTSASYKEVFHYHVFVQLQNQTSLSLPVRLRTN